ncbi:MAG: DUF1611 domain-containing protein, partial [Arenicellales bacterium]
LQVARLTNAKVRYAGMAINTAALSDDQARDYLSKLEDTYQLPAVDPFRTGVVPLVDAIL